MPKKLPKKFNKLTMDHFKEVRDSFNCPYWSFKFGVDGLKEYEIIIQPMQELNGKDAGVNVVLYDERQDPLLAPERVDIQIAKNKDGTDRDINKKDFARVIKAANDLYNQFYL